MHKPAENDCRTKSSKGFLAYRVLSRGTGRSKTCNQQQCGCNYSENAFHRSPCQSACQEGNFPYKREIAADNYLVTRALHLQSTASDAWCIKRKKKGGGERCCLCSRRGGTLLKSRNRFEFSFVTLIAAALLMQPLLRPQLMNSQRSLARFLPPRDSVFSKEM